MTQLEITLINTARQELESVKGLYSKHDQVVIKADGRDDYLKHLYALHALLRFGHQADTGMSVEGAKALLEIEQEHAEAFAALITSHAWQPK
ncbi:hypothetical protein [Pseudomonas sp. MWU12-2323]|uniref:hypothetical protein n=1 Tax=Pseudomonas sp. MWU12-2323 TaxID=2651296 RepID=UPI00128E5CD8|nr:hypothetical protein [Pseudomonas sp. MWU12-2323]MPQ71485.1 hypothetical protein [Pseudomonas sp. MWU12-2323]